MGSLFRMPTREGEPAARLRYGTPAWPGLTPSFHALMPRREAPSNGATPVGPHVGLVCQQLLRGTAAAPVLLYPSSDHCAAPVVWGRSFDVDVTDALGDRVVMAGLDARLDCGAREVRRV